VQELANIETEKGGILTQAYGAAISVVETIEKRFAITSAAAWAAATAGLSILIAGVASLVYYFSQADDAATQFAEKKLKDDAESAKAQEELQKSIYDRIKQQDEEFRKDLDRQKKDYIIKGVDNTTAEFNQLTTIIETYQNRLLSYARGDQAIELTKEREQEIQDIIRDATVARNKILDDTEKAASKIDDDNKKASRKALGDLMKEQIEAMREIDKMVEDGLFATADHLAEFRKTLSDSGADDPIITEETVKENKTNAEQMAKDIADSIKKYQKDKDKQRAEEEKMEKEAIAAAFSITKDISNALYQIESEKNKEKLDNKLSSLEKAKERELSNALLTSEQKTAIEEKYRRKEAEEKRKAWKADQQAKAEQAIINGFLGFTASLATQGYPAGLITGLLAIANAGVQAGLILSQPVPQFAKGTEYVEQGNAPSGVDTVHARLNIGERVVPTEINKQLAGIKNEDLPKLLQAAYYPPMPNAPEMSGLNAVVVKQDIDYKKLGKVIAEELRANPQTHINIDKGGFSLHVIEKGKKVQSLNNRYES
jgi:hypothetical protein